MLTTIDRSFFAVSCALGRVRSIGCIRTQAYIICFEHPIQIHLNVVILITKITRQKKYKHVFSSSEKLVAISGPGAAAGLLKCAVAATGLVTAALTLSKKPGPGDRAFSTGWLSGWLSGYPTHQPAIQPASQRPSLPAGYPIGWLAIPPGAASRRQSPLFGLRREFPAASSGYLESFRLSNIKAAVNA